jgi:predicted phage-related endonuclease
MRTWGTVPKPEHGSQKWLTVRWADEQGNRRISASAAAAIYGEHPYMSAADLYTELVSDEPPAPKESTADMERGNRLEPVLVKWASDLDSIELETPGVMYVFDENDAHLIATLDAISLNGIPYEVKTSRKRWTGELPRHWYWQGVHQAVCVDSEIVEWVVFDSDLTMHRYQQFVSSDEKQMHIQACASFLCDVMNGNIPDIVKFDYEHVQRMHPKSEAKSIVFGPEDIQLVDHLYEIRSEIGNLEKEEARIKGMIGQLLGDADTVVNQDGETALTWKSVERKSFDKDSFREQHPALYEKFQKTGSYRVMKHARRK